MVKDALKVSALHYNVIHVYAVFSFGVYDS